MRHKIIAIMGKAGSGKDTVMGEIVKLSKKLHNPVTPIISCTTRPIREGEEDGVNYHFLTNEDFANKVLDGDMIEATVFNHWCYGTAKSNLTLDKVNIGVFNPEGIEILQENNEADLYIVYITADDKVRLLRQLNREEHPNVDEIIRRFSADKDDFGEGRIYEINPHYILDNSIADVGMPKKLARKILEKAMDSAFWPKSSND